MPGQRAEHASGCIATLGRIRLAYPNMPGPRARIREQQSLLGQAATTSFSRPSREDPACSSATSPATSGCGILGTHGVLACCPESCGTCGGVGCELRQGGRTCCAGFAASPGPCGATGAPCKPARAAQATCCPGRRQGVSRPPPAKPQRPRRDATSMSKRKNNGQGSEHGTPAELRLRTNCTGPTADRPWQERTGIHFHVTVLAPARRMLRRLRVVPANIELRAPKPRCFSFATQRRARDANVSRRQNTMGFVYAGHALPLHCRSAAVARRRLCRSAVVHGLWQPRARRRRFSTTRSLSSSVQAICSAVSPHWRVSAACCPTSPRGERRWRKYASSAGLTSPVARAYACSRCTILVRASRFRRAPLQTPSTLCAALRTSQSPTRTRPASPWP